MRPRRLAPLAIAIVQTRSHTRPPAPLPETRQHASSYAQFCFRAAVNVPPPRSPADSVPFIESLLSTEPVYFKSIAVPCTLAATTNSIAAPLTVPVRSACPISCDEYCPVSVSPSCSNVNDGLLLPAADSTLKTQTPVTSTLFA